MTIRFSLTDWFFYTCLAVFPLGWVRAWGVLLGLSVSAAAMLMAVGHIHRLQRYQSVILIWHALLLFGFYAFPIVDIVVGSPYVEWYNHHMADRAKSEGLIGADERLVTRTLGRPYARRTSSDGSNASYYYAPYRHVPFPLTLFRVHFTNGRVDWIEIYEELEEETTS